MIGQLLLHYRTNDDDGRYLVEFIYNKLVIKSPNDDNIRAHGQSVENIRETLFREMVELIKIPLSHYIFGRIPFYAWIGILPKKKVA